MKITLKLREWLFRYGPAELVSLTVVVGVTTLIFLTTRSRIWSAAAGSLAEAPTYYTVMWLREGRLRPTCRPSRRLKDLCIEFAPAGIVAGFLRPLLLYKLPIVVGSIAWGTAIGKLAADACFYALVIVVYESFGRHNASGSNHGAAPGTDTDLRPKGMMYGPA